jgi:hypothetical protein
MMLDINAPWFLGLIGYTIVGIWWGGNLNNKVSTALLLIAELKQILDRGELLHCREHKQVLNVLDKRIGHVENELTEIRRRDNNGLAKAGYSE